MPKFAYIFRKTSGTTVCDKEPTCNFIGDLGTKTRPDDSSLPRRSKVRGLLSYRTKTLDRDYLAKKFWLSATEKLASGRLSHLRKHSIQCKCARVKSS